ncbi:MAG: dihydrolipoamide acyltransferase [Burkholderiales bacterium RIFCSPLOWO2_02_FULL_57_36]|nr:MAG: dihydrolipoamide acyltransferase [Burkholderiales bacterium RIFCSPLOWO2_02_FULL_57_36]
MKTSKSILLIVSIASIGLLAFALYLQHVEKMQPCPMCIIQRYAFVAVALICIVFAALPRGAVRTGAGLGALASVAGAGTAGWHLWVIANPSISCGIDPLETSLNTIPTANLLPFLFKADGLCSTIYEPILGLSIPQWSLTWFVIFTIVLTWVAFRRSR